MHSHDVAELTIQFTDIPLIRCRISTIRDSMLAIYGVVSTHKVNDYWIDSTYKVS